jgi:diguanylate cyclase (GGDEF)-like protein
MAVSCGATSTKLGAMTAMPTLDGSPQAVPLVGGPLAGRLLTALLASEGGMLAVKDAASGRYLHVDDAMARFLGTPATEVIGRTDAEWFDGATVTALRAAEQTALSQPAPLWSEHRLEWQGRAREFRVLRLVDGANLGSLWLDRATDLQREQQLRVALDQLEQLQRANTELRRELADQALRDPASGLYTRAHFEDQLRREADLSSREHREFALVLIELDPPGEAVQALGEPARAHVLEAIGRLLRGGTRAMDASCRLEGSRFAVLLSGVGLATAHARMEGLRRRCATQIVLLDGRELGFTVAMGVASFPHTAQTLPELMGSCEAALTEARRRGGNHVTLASIPLGRP